MEEKRENHANERADCPAGSGGVDAQCLWERQQYRYHVVGSRRDVTVVDELDAGANVANLALVRGQARARELDRATSRHFADKMVAPRAASPPNWDPPESDPGG